MGSGMTEGCIWLGSARRTGPVVAGSTLWSRKSRGVVASWRWLGTGVGKGKNWEGAVQDYAHRRTQVATVGNTMTARVLDECNSPSLPIWSKCKKGRVRPCSDHRAKYLSLQFRAQHPSFD
jgi:hypothetical protein